MTGAYEARKRKVEWTTKARDELRQISSEIIEEIETRAENIVRSEKRSVVDPKDVRDAEVQIRTSNVLEKKPSLWITIFLAIGAGCVGSGITSTVAGWSLDKIILLFMIGLILLISASILYLKT